MKAKKSNKKLLGIILVIVVLLILSFVLKKMEESDTQTDTPVDAVSTPEPTVSDSGSQSAADGEIPPYSGEPFYVLNDNQPEFKEDEITTKAYEYFSQLDSLGRCGVTMSCVGVELMPTEERESISSVKPSGWVNVPYDFVDGRYLYNRCHLIGFQLTGENANKLNLITGTRYMNVEGMLPFENMVADYVKETKNHVMYRVTPIFVGDELVARGVQLEAYSVEDEGDGLCFNVYVYNVQPGVVIDYATGESKEGDPTGDAGVSLKQENSSDKSEKEEEFVLNTNSKKFHLPSCSGASSMSEKNRKEFSGTRDTLIKQGYEPCSQCNP